MRPAKLKKLSRNAHRSLARKSHAKATRSALRSNEVCHNCTGQALHCVSITHKTYDKRNLTFAVAVSQVAPDLDPHIEYNITHDNDLVAMAFTLGDQRSCNNIGIDVMKVRIPGRESFASFVETVGDQVGYPFVCALCSLKYEYVTVNSN
jgi:4'-phosphopantetheinyl transferase